MGCTKISPERILEELIECGVMTEDGEQLTSTESYEQSVEKQIVEGEYGNQPESNDETNLDTNPIPRVEHHFETLEQFGTALPEEHRFRAAVFLTQFPDNPPTDGVPDSFLAVTGPALQQVLQFVEKAIIYIWRDDCDPCDIMKMEYDNIFQEPPDDLTLLAVYGSDWGSLLRSEFDIVGAPTTLFVRNSVVDARLIGAHYPKAIEHEIAVLRDQ